MAFLEEYKKLFQLYPHAAFNQSDVENCEYTDYMTHAKNCYYVFDGSRCEDVYYSDWVGLVKDCTDCSHVLQSEFCYECLDCNNCYNGNFLWDCENTRDSEFCFNCNGCRNCFLCSGLRKKEFCVLNKQYTKDEYLKKIAELKEGKGRGKSFTELWDELFEFSAPTPRIYAHFTKSENCVGDFLFYASNIYYGFGIFGERDAFYVYDFGSAAGKSCDNCDCMLGGNCELCYEGLYIDRCYNCDFLFKVEDCVDCTYCTECYQCKNCFGCAYLKHKQYYILNEKYEKEEYFKKVEEIKNDLKKSGKYTNEVFL